MLNGLETDAGSFCHSQSLGGPQPNLGNALSLEADARRLARRSTPCLNSDAQIQRVGNDQISAVPKGLERDAGVWQ